MSLVAMRGKIVLVLWMLLFDIAIAESNICPQPDGEEKCCTGSRKINVNCTACIGFMGDDCQSPCPYGYYGSRCEETCNCTTEQHCNQYVGCLPHMAKKNFSTSTQANTSIDREDVAGDGISCETLTMLFYCLCGTLGLVIVICIVTFCCWRCSKNSKQNSKTGSDKFTDSSNRREYPRVRTRNGDSVNLERLSRSRDSTPNHYDQCRFTTGEPINNLPSDYNVCGPSNEQHFGSCKSNGISSFENNAMMVSGPEFALNNMGTHCPSINVPATSSHPTRPYSLVKHDREDANKNLNFEPAETGAQDDDGYHRLIPL